jgi:putative ABC transport system permease protein
VSWTAVRALARTELRRHWRSLVALGVLAGIVGAVVTGAAALARRTSSAHDRLAASAHLDDARISLTSDAVSPRELESLPGVRQVWVTRQVIGQVLGTPGVTYVSVSSSLRHPKDLLTPVLVAGRDVHEDAADEVVLPEVFAADSGLRVGDTVQLKLLAPIEFTQFDTGFGEPDGPRVRLRVVGLIRADRAWLGNGLGPFFTTRAFYEAHRASLVGYNLAMRLDGGPRGVARFQQALQPLANRTPTDPTGKEFGVLSSAFPTSLNQPSLNAARHTLGGGLLVFVAIAAIGGLLAIAQGLGRHHSLGAAEQRVEAALGLTRVERAAARLLPATLGAAVAVVVAVAGGLASAALEPLGSLGNFEPSPGWRPDLLVIAACAAGIGLVFLAVAAVTAARTLPWSGSTSQVGGAAPGAGRWGRRASTAAGLSFAVSSGHGRTSVPVRTTMIAATLGVLGVVAVTTFGASLQRLEREPARYGWTADFAVVDFKPAHQKQLVADDRVADVAVVHDLTIRADDQHIDVVTVTNAKGRLPFTVIDGRRPTAAWQIALGTRTARRLDATVGDTVMLSTRSGPHAARVVGLIVSPDITDNGLGTASLVTPATLATIGDATPFATGLVRARPGTDVDKLFNQLAAGSELQRAAAPLDVRNLIDLGGLPRLLASFLALVAAGVLAHGLVLTTRRRSRDLAVLRAIGFTPWQVAAALLTAACTAAVVGLVVGVPLGLAVGRVIWFEVADGIGVAGDIAVPIGLLLLLVPAVVAGAVAVALHPARQAARQSPAVGLREE